MPSSDVVVVSFFFFFFVVVIIVVVFFVCGRRRRRVLTMARRHSLTVVVVDVVFVVFIVHGVRSGEDVVFFVDVGRQGFDRRRWWLLMDEPVVTFSDADVACSPPAALALGEGVEV